MRRAPAPPSGGIEPPSDDDDPGPRRRGSRRRIATGLTPVINATGVVLHTNLGRAPLSPVAQARLPRGRAGSYSNLEMDVSRKERGSRVLARRRPAAARSPAPRPRSS